MTGFDNFQLDMLKVCSFQAKSARDELVHKLNHVS